MDWYDEVQKEKWLHLGCFFTGPDGTHAPEWGFIDFEKSRSHIYQQCFHNPNHNGPLIRDCHMVHTRWNPLAQLDSLRISFLNHEGANWSSAVELASITLLRQTLISRIKGTRRGGGSVENENHNGQGWRARKKQTRMSGVRSRSSMTLPLHKLIAEQPRHAKRLQPGVVIFPSPIFYFRKFRIP